MQTEQNPPIWCFKILYYDATGEHVAYRTGPLFQRPRDAKRAAMVWAVNFAGRRRFSDRSPSGAPTSILVSPQVFQQRR